MKITAVPIFGEVVAPRFCFAAEILIVEEDLGPERRNSRVTLEGLDAAARLRLLHDRGVEMLLCGGFDRRLLPLAESLGIEVVWGLSGDVETVLENREAWRSGGRS